MLLDLIQPLLLGMKWMDPGWLLGTFGSALFWLSLAIVFVECGLFFPFLPGDTLLFAMGLFIGTDRVDIVPGGHGVDLVVALVLFIAAAFAGNVVGYEIGRKIGPRILVLFIAAAFAGNVVGYEIGRKIGPRIYERNGKVLKREYLEQTSRFFEVHGSKALVIGRFVPFVRTFITLVAGVTQMNRAKFMIWSAVGAVLWVASITLLGYFLGRSFPWLGDNIDYVTIGLLLITVIPIAIEVRRKRKGGRSGSGSPSRESVRD